MQISEITKSIVNVLTLVVSVGTLVLQYTTGFLPENIALWISGGVALAGAVVHFLAPNTTTDPNVAKTQSVRLRKSHATNTAA
jgi:hypothetical protein